VVSFSSDSSISNKKRNNNSNRQETYEYFQLPYCKGEATVEHRHETLGEALLGMELVNSGIPIKFPRMLSLSFFFFFFFFVPALFIGLHRGAHPIDHCHFFSISFFVGLLVLHAPWTIGIAFILKLFIEEEAVRPICPEYTLSSQDVKTFSYAVSHDYWFQYFIDDLPVWGNKYFTIDDNRDELPLAELIHTTLTFTLFAELVITRNGWSQG
jgi:hypothetical protein